ncbi:MAG TPA: exosortase H [Thermodesulfovibrionales bacterium]|nr:exosortase H [Thermodesulfovibrionales bacterium]
MSGATSLRRFAVTYIILMGAFFFLIGFVPLQKMFDLNGLYTEGVVKATAQVLGAMRVPATCDGSLIHLPAISLDVKFGCNGLEAVMIYSVAVIAFPSPWKKRLIGIGAGFVVLQTLNILRIAFLAYAGIHFKSLFEYLHIYVAQGIMIAVSLGIFLIYLRYAEDRE